MSYGELVHSNDPLLLDFHCIWVEVGVGADAELSEDRCVHGHADIAHLELLRQEVVTGGEVQVVYELDLLGSGSGRILEVTYLCLEVVSEGEIEARSLSLSRRTAGSCSGVDVIILCLDLTVPVRVGQCPVSIEICSFFRTERC